MNIFAKANIMYKNVKGEMYMSEESKIQNIIKQYEDFFKNSSADIASTIKGERFFYLTDEVSGEISNLVRFKTAKELEQIILHEITDDLNFSLEVGLENISTDINERDIAHEHCEFGYSLIRLADSLDTIQKEFNKWDSKIQSSLKGLNTFISNYGGAEEYTQNNNFYNN